MEKKRYEMYRARGGETMVNKRPRVIGKSNPGMSLGDGKSRDALDAKGKILALQSAPVEVRKVTSPLDATSI